MASSTSRILIVGCGPGSADYVTPAARRAVRRADVLIGSKRLLELFPKGGKQRVQAGADVNGLLGRIGEFLAAGRRIVVLVSGDPGLFSLAHKVVERFGRRDCGWIAGVSSVQVAFARLCLDWSDARIVSAHGRRPDVDSCELADEEKIAILAGTNAALRWSGDAAAKLAGTHDAYLCEDLTLPGERVRQVTADDLRSAGASSLSIVLLIRKGCQT